MAHYANKSKNLRYEPVEVTIPAGSTQLTYALPNTPNLENKKICGIETYTNDTITTSPLTGLTVVQASTLQNAFLTLIQDNLQVLNNLPVLRLNVIQNSNPDPFVRNMLPFEYFGLSFQKSSIQFKAAPAETNVVILLGFYYYDESEDGTESLK